jgi:hypothetical protein
MNLQKIAWIFAGVFSLIGILGFVPGITTDGYLLGIFEVDTLHNIIHLLSGIAAAFAAYTSMNASKIFFKTFGIIYGIVTIVGLIQGDTVLGLIGVNMADNLLHLIITASSLYLGFGNMKAMPGAKI